MALWGTVPAVYGFTRAEMPESKVSWTALCTHLHKQWGASTKRVPSPYCQQWAESGRQTCWMTGWRCLHSFIRWPHCRTHEWLLCFLWTTEVKLYIFLIALLFSWFIWQFGAALWAGMEDLSFPYFFGRGYFHWSIVFFTELTSYQRKMMAPGCFWQKGTFFENKHKVWLVIMSMTLKDTMKYKGCFSMHQKFFIIELLLNKKNVLTVWVCLGILHYTYIYYWSLAFTINNVDGLERWLSGWIIHCLSVKTQFRCQEAT